MTSLIGELRPPIAGIGPGLALLDAVREGRLDLVKAMVTAITPETIVDSVSEVIHRMLVHSDVAEDVDDLTWLAEITNHRWAYTELALHAIERYVPWTPAQMYARRFADAVMSHYLERLFNGDLPTRMPLPKLVGSALLPLELVLGAAYTMTLIAYELADADEADLDERITALRSFAAANAR